MFSDIAIGGGKKYENIKRISFEEFQPFLCDLIVENSNENETL